MADNLSHEYQLESLMSSEQKVVTKNLSFGNSFWVRLLSIKKRYTTLKLLREDLSQDHPTI